MDTTVHPPLVARLDYELSAPPDDEMFESFPCFVVSAGVRTTLEGLAVTGCAFGPVTITRECQFDTLWPGVVLPEYWWLQVHGTAGVDDLGIAADLRLVMSDRVLAEIRDRINHADVSPYAHDRDAVRTAEVRLAETEDVHGFYPLGCVLLSFPLGALTCIPLYAQMPRAPLGDVWLQWLGVSLAALCLGLAEVQVLAGAMRWWRRLRLRSTNGTKAGRDAGT